MQPKKGERRKPGRPAGVKKYPERVIVRFDKNVLEALDGYCERHNERRSDVIRGAVSALLQKGF